ncbi:hypothetical protein ACQJBY_069309 [Aegilops geniculata]
MDFARRRRTTKPPPAPPTCHQRDGARATRASVRRAEALGGSRSPSTASPAPPWPREPKRLHRSALSRLSRLWIAAGLTPKHMPTPMASQDVLYRSTIVDFVSVWCKRLILFLYGVREI